MTTETTETTEMRPISGKTMASITSYKSGGSDNFGNWGWMDRVADLLHNSVETIDVIGSVVYDTDGAVGFMDGVLSLDDIAVTVLALGFDVTSHTIGNSVVVGVTWVGLNKIQFVSFNKITGKEFY